MSACESVSEIAEVQDLFEEGTFNLQRGCFERALESFSNALEFAPTSTKLLCLRSLVNFELGKFNDSLNDAVTALEFDATDPGFHYRKGMALLAQGNINEAFEASVVGLKKCGENPGLLGIQVMALFAQEKYAELLPKAKKCLQQSTETDLATKVIYCFTTALTKLREKQQDGFKLHPAIQDVFTLAPFKLQSLVEECGVNPFTEVIKMKQALVPKKFENLDNAESEAHVSALLDGAMKECEKGNLADAEQLLQTSMIVAQFVGLPHREQEVIILLGLIYCMQGKVTESIELQKPLLETLAPKAKVYSSLGNSYYAHGNFREALEYHKKHLALEQAITGDGDNTVAARNNAACAYTALGRFKEAIVDFTICREHARKTNNLLDFIAVSNNIAGCYFHLHQLDKCHQVLQEALEKHPLLYEQCMVKADTLEKAASQRQSYINCIRQTYKIAVGLYVDVKNLTTAAEIAERAKTLSWVDKCSARITKSEDAFVSNRQLQMVATRENMVFLSYNFINASTLYVFITSSKGTTMIPLSWPQDSFQWDPVAFATYMLSEEADNSNLFHRRTREILTKLYKILILPLEQSLPRDSSIPLVIFPHEKLLTIPWNALVDSDGHYNIELRVITVALCAATFVSNLEARRVHSESPSVKGVAVFDSSITDSDKQKAAYASLGYLTLDGSRIHASEIVKKLGGRGNVHFSCRITCREVASFNASSTVDAKFSEACRTRDTFAELSDHHNPWSMGSLYFGAQDPATNFVNFRMAHALPISALEQIPGGMKAAKIVTLHAYTESMDDIYTAKTSVLSMVRALMASDATCVISTIFPLKNPTASSELLRDLSEKVSACSRTAGMALSFRDALMEAKANGVSWAVWSSLMIFM